MYNIELLTALLGNHESGKLEMLSMEQMQDFLLEFTQEIMEKTDSDEIMAKTASTFAETSLFSSVSISLFDRLYEPEVAKEAKISRRISLEICDSGAKPTAASTKARPKSLEIPIIVREQNLGYVTLRPKKKGFSLSKDDFRYYQLIANVAGVSINHSRTQGDLERLSIHDELTGCFNRRYLSNELDNKIAWAKRYERKFSLLIIDLDGFKEINDQHGHLFGDHVLRQFGEWLKDIVRASDLVFRYGGDEFAVILQETQRSHAQLMIARITKALLKQTFKVGKISVKLRMSVGVSTFGENGEEFDSLVDAADRACYEAKIAKVE
jgi:diguanylate cyclase (GGDEF)-like protein